MINIKTTLLLIFCLVLMAAKCQEPDTIICYSVEDMQIKDDIIEAQNILLEDTIEYFESLIESNNIRSDTFDLVFESDGAIITAKRIHDDIWLSIIEDKRRSHLWRINNEIEVRFFSDSTKPQTWLPKQRIINY